MKYSEFLDVLFGYQDTEFADFQRKLIPTKQKIIGVRTPIMRKLAKEYAVDMQDVFTFPDEYFEVTFIKLALISNLPYEKFVQHVEHCVSVMDNWATCDCFKAKCIKQHREEFLPILENLFNNGTEFYQRYVLVVLLSEYVEKAYLSRIEQFIQRADTNAYYVHMAVAWLVAEILIHLYDDGVLILQKNILPIKTHNKAIQKAIESYRLTNEQKEFLRSLKIKTKKL